jgi:uncharacterized SAM-binding protein YcdF (DUF218 family)
LSPANVPRNTGRRTSRRISPRSSSHGSHGPQRKRAGRRPLGWKAHLAIAGGAVAFAVLVWAAIARGLAPTANTALTRFDAIIVLGTPADGDGNPTPEQLARVTEAVNEYKRGVAPRLILTGGAAHNHFVEAQVMERSAEAQGVPESAIFVETHAMNTIQNACYSVRIMKAHGWRSAEVVSSASQLPRASLIFNSLPVEWSEHAAPSLSPESAAYQSAVAAVEVLKTARYLIWARWMDHCEP